MRKFLAMVCGMVLFAAASQGADDLAIARSALRDGLWELARCHVTNRIDAESRLITLESYAGEGKWNEIAKVLSQWTELRGDGFDYYRAVVRGDHSTAIDILKRVGSESGLVEAEMYEAAELAKAGDITSANAIWRDVLGKTNLSERVLVSASVNLGDVKELRRAYAEVLSAALKRKVGLRLGRVLIANKATANEGEQLVRAIVKDSPDAEGAEDAFLALVDRKVSDECWNEARALIGEAVETWPALAKRALLQENRGWTMLRLGRPDEALEAFDLATTLSNDDEDRARTMLKSGDALAAAGKKVEAQLRYRQVLDGFPKTKVAMRAKTTVEICELESRGRRLYKEFRFGEAMNAFRRVAELDSEHKPLMDYFCMLCSYGQGHDETAFAEATRLAAVAVDQNVRARATLWAAKFEYNRGNWKDSQRLFSAYAALATDQEESDALLWSARSAFASGEFQQAIQLSTRIVGRHPDSAVVAQALQLQGEALMELSRYEEAVLVFDRVAATSGITDSERTTAKLLKADALYAIGADNPVRYSAAYELYNAIRFDGSLSASDRIAVAFKLAKTLEKLKRTEEAFDVYYSQVVLAYRDGRQHGGYYDDGARAAFSRAAFWLADECERRGRDRQAISVLELVFESDVPAAEEAKKRIRRISTKGRLL